MTKISQQMADSKKENIKKVLKEFSNEKTGKRAEYKGQVELYLKWLDKYEKAEGEESPIAIILCATKSDMMAQLLELDNSGIHVAQYLTEYVPKEILQKNLIDSIEKAKIQLEQRKNIEDKE